MDFIINITKPNGRAYDIHGVIGDFNSMLGLEPTNISVESLASLKAFDLVKNYDVEGNKYKTMKISAVFVD